MGLVLFLLNVLWSLGLGFDMWWNLFGDSVTARVCGMVAGERDGADDGAEERGVETVEEAKALLAQRDATIAQLTAANAEKDCRERIASVTSTATPHQSCISTYRTQQAAEITSLRTAKDKNKQITRSGSRGSARGDK